MYTCFIYLVITSYAVQISVSQVVHFEFTNPYKAWIEARRTCNKLGGSILDVRVAYPHLFRFSHQIVWTNNFKAYTPWYHSRGCFNMTNITFNSGFIVDDIEDCLTNCSDKYDHFAIQGNICSCISLYIGSEYTVDMKKCYKSVTERHRLQGDTHLNYRMIYTKLNSSFDNADDQPTDFDDITSKNCIILKCNNNKSATYLPEECSQKHTGLCSNSKTTDEVSTWKQAQGYCESIHKTLALQQSSLNDVKSGCGNINNSRRYWIGTLRTQIKHGLLDRDVKRLNLYCQNVNSYGRYIWTTDCLKTKHRYMCGWDTQNPKITIIDKMPFRNKTEEGGSSNRVTSYSDGQVTTKVQMKNVPNGGKSHFIFNYKGIIAAITSSCLLML